MIGQGWTRTDKLKVDDTIASIDTGTFLYVKSLARAPPQDTYNFEVADFHTYFVGVDGAWVHNVCLKRPHLRKGLRDKVEAGGKTPNGEWVDANTGEIFTGQKHFGHVYGRENRRLLKEAEAKGMTQKELNDSVNSHPEWFQIETPANNLSGKYEKPGG